MAAIYSGIHLKLKSPHTPWEDKLKLARFAWISSQCLLPNKEQVLLDWCTHALTGWYNKKVEYSHSVLEGLWCYLDDLLHSRKLHSLLKQGKTVSLRLNMAQLLLDRLQECAYPGSKSLVRVSTILSVCQSIVSSPVLSSIFIAKYELMVDLLVKLCSLACNELQQPQLTETTMTESATCQDQVMSEHLEAQPVANRDSADTSKFPSKPNEKLLSLNIFELVLQVLSCYLAVQRQQANPNRVFSMVTNQLLQPLVLLRHLLTSTDLLHTKLHLRQQLCRDIRVKIDSTLHFALFPSEHLMSYKEELLPSKDNSGKRGAGGAKGPLKPVTVILSKLSARGYCEPVLLYSVKSNTLSLLFKLFLDSYGKGRGENEEEQRMLCYYFLVRIIPALDLCIDGEIISPAEGVEPVSASLEEKSPQSWSLALLGVESLLSQALSANIYNVAADRIRHREVQLSFYRHLGQILFNQAQPSIPAWYRCLKVLLGLNHLILEPDLDQLLSSAWVNSQCMDARVQRARQVIVCSLLQTYTKLRQLPHLFSELLSVICQSDQVETRPPLLSDMVSTSLRTCLQETPPSQGLEICSLVLESMRRDILPELLKAEKMENDGGQDHEGEIMDVNMNQEKHCASLKLLSLGQLLHAVLFNLKTLDNASPLPLVKQGQALMKQMQEMVNDLLKLLSVEKPPGKTKFNSSQKIPRKGKKCINHKESETVSAWEQKTQEAALLLRYTWMEVDTLFHLHCSKYTSFQKSQTGDEANSNAPITQLESLLSGDILPARLHSSPSCSPMSFLLYKMLTLQQMKILLSSVSLCEPSIAALLNTAVQFILSKLKFEVSLDGEQVWDGQISNVNSSSYAVAHWHLVTSNLPLIAPYLNREDVDCVADILVTSVLSRQTDVDRPSTCLTVSLISSELLQSPILAEIPSLFSATVCSLIQRITDVLMVAHKYKVCASLPTSHVSSQPLSTLVKNESLVEDILSSSKTGEVFVLLTDKQTRELINLVQILMSVNPDGMNSEVLSSVFLLLFYILTSCSCLSDPVVVERCDSGNDIMLLVSLLKMLTILVESRNLKSVLKVIHGGTLLQAALSSLLWHSINGRFSATSSSDWLELIKAVQDFIRSLTELIVTRGSSVVLNLEQFVSFLTSKERPEPGQLISSVHIELASLTCLAQTLNSNLGRSKSMDQTLTQMISRVIATLGPAVESILRLQTLNKEATKPASVLGQAFVVDVGTVMLHCELSLLSMNTTWCTLNHMTLYQGLCQHILRDLCSSLGSVDSLLSSLQFLSTFYKAAERMRGDKGDGGTELERLYLHILQGVHSLLTAPHLSSEDISELESAVQELLCHLLEKSTTDQLTLLLVNIRGGLNAGKLRTGNYREVLSAVTIIKLLFCCQLPETCTKALWLIAPQIISTLVFMVRMSSQDAFLTLPFTVPTVKSMTSLLRQGEGLITNPHHVIVVLGALQSISLDHLTPYAYKLAFSAVHEALFAIIQCHPQVLLNAAPSFLNVFYHLVVSIMHEGRQRGESDTGSDSDVYLQCSRLIERMYSHIAVSAESSTTLSAFIVAQYVTELQKVTLRPDIKLHLTEGIYQILDLCTEQDIKFLMGGLQTGVREVFNELYSNYTHYHKTRRQGEDKYTV